MDKLEFKIQDIDRGYTTEIGVSIYVNSKNLIDVVKKHELPFAKKENKSLAGNYAELDPYSLYKHLTKPRSYDYYNNNKVALLGCVCGIEECWPLVAKIKKSGDKIFWTNFESPRRTIESQNYFDYSNFRQFEFSKVQYLEQIEKLKAYLLAKKLIRKYKKRLE